MDEALGVVNFGKEGKIKGRRASRFGLLEADSSFLFADLFEGSIEKVRMVSNLRKRYHTYCHNYRRFKLQTDPAFNLWRVILNCGCYYFYIRNITRSDYCPRTTPDLGGRWCDRRNTVAISFSVGDSEGESSPDQRRRSGLSLLPDLRLLPSPGM